MILCLSSSGLSFLTTILLYFNSSFSHLLSYSSSSSVLSSSPVLSLPSSSFLSCLSTSSFHSEFSSHGSLLFFSFYVLFDVIFYWCVEFTSLQQLSRFLCYLCLLVFVSSLATSFLSLFFQSLLFISSVSLLTLPVGRLLPFFPESLFEVILCCCVELSSLCQLSCLPCLAHSLRRGFDVMMWSCL